jgi:histone deacetylase 6
MRTLIRVWASEEFVVSTNVCIFTQPNSRHWFYPGTGKPNEIGSQKGAGTNLNIVWGQGGMGDVEYAAAFAEVVLPVLSSFGPDLILIAAGFDAAKGDLLGDCGLSPEMYYAMMNSVLEAAGRSTPVVCILEGGYNLDVLATCSEATALALLDEPWYKMGHDSESGEFSRTSTILESGESGAHFSLDRYWKREAKAKEQLGEGKATKHAMASIRKAAKAMAKEGKLRNTGSVHCITPPPSYLYGCRPFHRPSLMDYDRYPIKKRRIRNDLDYSQSLYQLSDL